MGDHLGHQVSAEGVPDEHQADDGQRRPQGAPGRLQDQNDADDGNDEIGGRRQSGPIGQLAIKKKYVGGTECRHRGQHPVQNRDVLTR